MKCMSVPKHPLICAKLLLISFYFCLWLSSRYTDWHKCALIGHSFCMRHYLRIHCGALTRSFIECFHGLTLPSERDSGIGRWAAGLAWTAFCGGILWPVGPLWGCGSLQVHTGWIKKTNKHGLVLNYSNVDQDDQLSTLNCMKMGFRGIFYIMYAYRHLLVKCIILANWAT